MKSKKFWNMLDTANGTQLNNTGILEKKIKLVLFLFDSLAGENVSHFSSMYVWERVRATL